MSTTTIGAQSLTERLEDVASIVRATSPKLRALIGRPDCDVMTSSDYAADSLSCAFEAFAALGGSRERHDDFDWVGKRNALIQRARRCFRRLLQGKGSTYYDCRWRNSPRQVRNPGLAWAVWEQRFERHDAPPTAEVVDSYLTEVPQQERDMRRRQLEGLFAELKQVLLPRDFKVLLLHYGYRRRQRELARKLDMTENHMNQVISRARERARARLGPKWRVIAAEIL